MDTKLRELLDSAKATIDSKIEEDIKAKDKQIEDFYKDAEYFQRLFYEKVAEEMIEYYKKCKTSEIEKTTDTQTLKYVDSKRDKRDKDVAAINLIKERGKNYTPLIPSTVGPNYYTDNDRIYEAIIFQNDYGFNERSCPVLFKKRHFTDIGIWAFCSVSPKDAVVTIIYSLDKVENFIKGVLSSDPKYDPFRTYNIANMARNALTEIEIYEQDQRKKEEVYNKVNEASLENVKEVSLDICKKIIDSYQPDTGSFITHIECYTEDNMTNIVDRDLSNLVYNYVPKDNEKILLLPQDGKNGKIYVPVLSTHLNDVLKEIASEALVDEINHSILLTIVTDTDNFTKIVNNGNKTK